MTSGLDKVPGLLDAITMVDKAIALVAATLADNTTKEEERRLRKKLLELTEQRAALDAKLGAALADDSAVRGPSDAQVNEIGALTSRVEDATKNSKVVSERLKLATDVLDLAAKAIAPTTAKHA